MTDVKAAGLPEGSVVASRHAAWILAERENGPGTWYETDNDFPVYDNDVQAALDNGAQVLRHGYGDEGER